MTFLVATSARCLQFRQALAELEGLPRRSTVHGGPDKLPLVYAPGAAGWTDQVTELPVDDTGQSALEVPADYERHLGKTSNAVTLPAAATGVTEENLPPGLRTLVRARKGRDANGNPLPFP